MLSAYYDESGTHNQYGVSPIVCIAGFVGKDEEWRKVEVKWREIMKGETFHYTEYSLEKQILEQLADLLSSSDLHVVSAGFSGNWEEMISSKPDWKIRFPSCYHAVFEMCIDQMQRFSSQLWGDEPVALIFAEQTQYTNRAEEIWRTMRGNDLWPKLKSFSYKTPKDCFQLQAADMISHEIFRCMKAGNDEIWQKWPLVSRLLAKGIKGVAGYHTAESFKIMMEQSEKNGRQYLKNVPKSFQ